MYISLGLSITDLTIGLFCLPDEYKATGYGTLLATTLELWARNARLRRIVVPNAQGHAGSREWSGYYFWPKMGYDGELPRSARNRLAKRGIILPRGTTVQEMFRDYSAQWKACGCDLYNLTLEL